MDPTETLARFLDACHEQDREAALETIEQLHEWLQRGGFVPNVCEPQSDGSDRTYKLKQFLIF